jgi:hypothetical protein
VTRRLFYLALGATVGVLVVRKASQAAQRFTPAGVSQGVVGALNGLGDAIRGFGEDVRAGMAEREAELREGLGLDETGPGDEV